MSNEYYDHTTYPSSNSRASSSGLRSEFDLVENGFAKLPPLAGNSKKFVKIKTDESGLEASESFELLGLVTLTVSSQATFPANTRGVTAALGDNSTLFATTEFVTRIGLNSALPGQSVATIGKVPKSDGTNASWEYIDAPWQIKTTTYTAVNGDRIQANTTSSAWTLTLPATPAANDRVVVADYAGTFATNNLTIGRNGQKIMGLSEDYICDLNNETRAFEYIDATQGWRAI